MTAASQAQQARSLTQRFAKQLSGGGKRGPDAGVRRNSFDVDHPNAKVGARIGDGSVAHGLAHREALLLAAEELYHEGWRRAPAADVRAARQRHDALSAELDELIAAGSAPVGRPATIREEIRRLKALLDHARDRLRRIDLTVLKALLKRLDFKTGALFPSYDTIAADAGCHRNSAIAAIKRLHTHGFISWVRRSIRTGNDGQFAPQREQTSNAYFFDHQRRMAAAVFRRFRQHLDKKMRKAINLARGIPPTLLPAASADVVEQRSALASLAASLANAST